MRVHNPNHLPHFGSTATKNKPAYYRGGSNQRILGGDELNLLPLLAFAGKTKYPWKTKTFFKFGMVTEENI